MSLLLDVAIIGAGPYGLSLASHLHTQGVKFRIFGKPMHAWRTWMPAGMLLKSDVNSLDLSDPQNALGIKRFYADRDQSCGPEQAVPVEDFVAYGLEFQSRFVPEVEPQNVVSLEQDGEGYILKLSNQELVRTRQVVLAIGVYHFRYLPPALASLPSEFCSHSADYGSVEHLCGKNVAVIGSGASAIDIAIALTDAGAKTTIVSRRENISYQDTPATHKPSKLSRIPFAAKIPLFVRVWNMLSRLRNPNSGIGGGWKIKIYGDAPQIVYALPAKLRSYILRTTLGARPGYTTRARVDGCVPVLQNQSPHSASVENGKVKLTLQARDGATSAIEVDHVIAATGYQTDLKKLSFLAESIRKKIRTYENAPVLSRCFESTSPGLYFVGAASAMSFGPVMRFVYGAGFTMKRIVKRLVKARATYTSPESVIAFDTNK